jgi:hypothetical protein
MHPASGEEEKEIVVSEQPERFQYLSWSELWKGGKFTEETFLEMAIKT